MKTIRWIVLGVVGTVFLSTCSQQSQNASPTADKVTALNSSPQKEYPEFTLDAQSAAMQSLEDMRKKARVEGLREKTPPADWIAIAYHGLIVDANFDPIEMDFDTISKMQESLFSVLYEPARDKAMKQYGQDVKQLFFDQKIQGKDQLVARTAVLNALLDVSDPQIQDQYAWRHRLMQERSNGLVGWSQYVLPQSLREEFGQYRFPDGFFRPIPGSSEYVNSCRDQSVPIPPNWPDTRWISQGQLNFVFISQERSAEVFAYKDPDVPGVCYALPRRSMSTGSIELLGIICQSEDTGRACFWDNLSPDDVRLTGVDLSLEINNIRGGTTLSENCTNCHRGYNAFTIHPGSALDLSRSAAVGGPYDTAPAVRYTPMGQSTWVNPSPFMFRPVTAGPIVCTSCHNEAAQLNLPQTSSLYCSSVLPMAAMNTMPPFGTERAGWPPGMLNPIYRDQIQQLRASCP